MVGRSGSRFRFLLDERTLESSPESVKDFTQSRTQSFGNWKTAALQMRRVLGHRLPRDSQK